MLVPNWMALSARSWPISPLAGSSSSVVLKPSVAGLTTRRRSAASSGCGRAATVVTSPFLLAADLSYCARLKNAIAPPGGCGGREYEDAHAEAMKRPRFGGRTIRTAKEHVVHGRWACGKLSIVTR